MIALTKKMALPLVETTMVQEQLALALNRAGRGTEAESILKTLLGRQGPSSETCAILGRVYKDRWEAALNAGDNRLAGESLQKAIDAYRQGFEADWRDAFPGINAVTLMELKEPPDPARFRLLPVVAYAVNRRIAVWQARLLGPRDDPRTCCPGKGRIKGPYGRRPSTGCSAGRLGTRNHSSHSAFDSRSPCATRRGRPLGAQD